MEHRPTDSSEGQVKAPSRDAGGAAVDTDVPVEIMNRDKRHEALAWAQAHRLIRGGVDEVVQFIEGSQYTIELLLQALSEAACRHCDGERHSNPSDCETCRRRAELLAQLA